MDELMCRQAFFPTSHSAVGYPMPNPAYIWFSTLLARSGSIRNCLSKACKDLDGTRDGFDDAFGQHDRQELDDALQYVHARQLKFAVSSSSDRFREDCLGE